MADKPTTTDASASTSKVLWAVSMVVGPHPGVHIEAATADEAMAEYRKRYRLADNVELWAGKVP